MVRSEQYMTILEKMNMVAKAIRKLEQKLIVLQFCEYDGFKSFEERQEERRVIQSHLIDAHNALVLLSEMEEKVA